jgi:rhodanese-related sulfurtransferase
MAAEGGAADPPHTGVEELLAEARRGLRRLTPQEAGRAMEGGAHLVDLRSESQRASGGVVPGSHFIPRNVLEWRLDPACPHRDAALARHDSRLVLICEEGYQSSLAAATLQRFGLAEATDVIGGFRAWRAEGLPVQAGVARRERG